MPSSFTPSLRLTLPVTGENSGTWGDLVNNGITSLVDSSVAGYAAITMTDANYTLTSVNGAADEARRMMLNMSGTLTAARNVICPTASKLYFIKNATTGGFAITLKTSAGSGISIPNGRSAVLMCNGTDVVEAVDYSANINTANISYTGTLTGGTGIVNLGSGQFYKDASGNIGIGTASPSVPLQVTGAIRSQTASGTAPKFTLFQSGIVGWDIENAASTGVFGITNGVGYALKSESMSSGTAIYINSTNNVGLNTATPGSTLDVKGTLRLSGATSGYVGLAPAAAAGTTTYTLPTADGTSGQVLQTSGSAVLSWATVGLANFTSLLNTTAPNATVPVVSLLATNAGFANIDAAFTPKGTGAFTLQVADNATTGGNKRGTNAVDLQTSRGAATQVASGASSFTAGGSNTASNSFAVALGSSNSATGVQSFAAGNNNTAGGAQGVALGNGNSAGGGQSFTVGNNNSASATYSFAIGNGTTASGLTSFSSGAQSTASTEGSVVLGGSYGTSRALVGNRVFPALIGTTAGARQFTLVTLGLSTTDATVSYMTSDGTSSINSTTTNIVLPNNSAFYFKGEIVAGVTAAGNTKGWSIEGVVKRGASAATVVFVGTPTVTSSFADAGASGWTITVAVNTTIGGINIVATGQAATAIRWVGTIQVVEMSY